METDFESVLKSAECTVEKEKRDDTSCKIVRIRYGFPTSVDDLWDAVTSIKRLPLWFLPVSGDFKEGGHFKFEGNASGKIVKCVPKSTVSVTWEFGSGMSWLDVSVSSANKKLSQLTLEHTVPIDDHWKKYGPGATGVGWMLGLIGLVAHIDGYDYHGEGSDFDLAEFMQKPETRDFVINCSKIWAQADINDGETVETANTAAEETASFYLGG